LTRLICALGTAKEHQLQQLDSFISELTSGNAVKHEVLFLFLFISLSLSLSLCALAYAKSFAK